MWDDQEERWYFSIADVGHEGGKIAGDARKQLEKRVGHSVISPSKAADYLPSVAPIEEIPE